MPKINSANPTISLQDINLFQNENEVNLPQSYVEFLLKYNGGYPEESNFKISEEQGESLVNKFYGLGDMKSNLGKVFDLLEEEIPKEFISIANDPGGNEILIGVSGKFKGKIYFWVHDIEPENEMGNMFILADDFDEFLNNLYRVE